MPVDPSISMNVMGGAKGMMQPGAGAPASNPLELLGGIAEIQNKLNQNRAFAAAFRAKQKAGEILGGAPDVASGIAALQQDPETAAFAPELAQTAAATHQTMVSAAGQAQTQGREAFDNAIKQLPAYLQAPTPETWNTLVATSAALASPISRPGVTKSLGFLKDALDTAKTPEERRAMTAGWVIASGAGAAVPQILGDRKEINLGDTLQPSVVAPIQGGPDGQAPGTVTPAGNALGLGLPPQVAPAGGVAVGGKLGMGGGSASASPAPAPTTLAGEPVPDLAADGKPLFPKGFDDEAIKPGKDGTVRTIGGGPAGQLGDVATAFTKRFVENDTPAFNNAQLTKASLAELNHDFAKMVEGGGLSYPGTLVGFRNAIGKAAATLSGISGDKELLTDKQLTGLASAEDANKVIQRMGINYLGTAMGEQRQAAETIRNITDKGMPGIQHTYLGAKMMMTMIGALNDRSIDYYNAEAKWLSDHNGNLTNFDKAFNKHHPADDYINRSLETLGLTQTGFKSAADVQRALDQKLLTLEQAEAIRKNKGKIPDDLPRAK